MWVKKKNFEEMRNAGSLCSSAILRAILRYGTYCKIIYGRQSSPSHSLTADS